MRYVEQQEQLAGRRRTAGCGCVTVAFVLVSGWGIAALALTLGDCDAAMPHCHAGSDRLLTWLGKTAVAIGIAMAIALVRWADRPSDRDG